MSKKVEPYFSKFSHDFPLLSPVLSEEQQRLMLIATFHACGGVWFHDKKGWHARAYAGGPTALLPLLVFKGSHIDRRGKKGYVWVVDRKATVKWLDQALTSVFKPRPQELPVCPHCGADSGAKHDPECYLSVGN
jgi:hypothetical protein